MEIYAEISKTGMFRIYQDGVIKLSVKNGKWDEATRTLTYRLNDDAFDQSVTLPPEVEIRAVSI
jgi:hypothetical protein